MMKKYTGRGMLAFCVLNSACMLAEHQKFVFPVANSRSVLIVSVSSQDRHNTDITDKIIKAHRIAYGNSRTHEQIQKTSANDYFTSAQKGDVAFDVVADNDKVTITTTLEGSDKAEDVQNSQTQKEKLLKNSLLKAYHNCRNAGKTRAFNIDSHTECTSTDATKSGHALIKLTTVVSRDYYDGVIKTLAKKPCGHYVEEKSE